MIESTELAQSGGSECIRAEKSHLFGTRVINNKPQLREETSRSREPLRVDDVSARCRCWPIISDQPTSCEHIGNAKLPTDAKIDLYRTAENQVSLVGAMSPLTSVLVLLSIGLATCQDLNNVYKKLQFQSNHNRAFNQQQASPMQQAMESIRPIITSLEEKCEAAGKASVAQGLENKVSNAFACIGGKLDFGRIQQEIGAAQRTGSDDAMDKAFDDICQIWPDSKNCVQPIFDDVKICLNDTEYADFNLYLTFMDATNNFFCDDNHQRIDELLHDPQAAGCLMTVSNDIKDCGREKADQLKPKLQFDNQDCSDFQEVRQCIVSKMDSCPTQTPVKMVDDYLELVHKMFCNSAPSLSSVSAFNVLLLLCTYLFSKMF
ncbi:unnamed protein product [Phyllotreta striolata]|uniref:27 kDa hemolymph protein n=1 Tax=Phyllotreta striolata TaxID=444603 RepID=A0A9N9XVA9_PHYSR|nr:unnamed protein product [Phyllotreta striolata]